jgi:hypothetical protein
VKTFQVGTSAFDRCLGSFTPMTDVAGFLFLLLTSSEGFRFRLLCSLNSPLDGGAVRAVLTVSL